MSENTGGNDLFDQNRRRRRGSGPAVFLRRAGEGAKSAFHFVTHIPRFVVAGIVSLILMTAVLFFAPVLREWVFTLLPGPRIEAAAGKASSREIEKQRKRIESLKQQFEALTPRRSYLVVDTSNNHVYLKTGKKLVHDAVCSTGSYVLLKAGDDRHWIFKTPRGRFYIQKKEESPVWHKPDWAFIEEGLPVPPAGAKERYETGVLGDYALHLGHGYLIHGTLYTRLLGMPVTHGCVRLNDETLSLVYRTLNVGSAVFIY